MGWRGERFLVRGFFLVDEWRGEPAATSGGRQTKLEVVSTAGQVGAQRAAPLQDRAKGKVFGGSGSSRDGCQFATVNSTGADAATRAPPNGDWSITEPCGHCGAVT